MMLETHATCHTLLERACNTQDERAWEEFVQHYRRFILYILQKLNVHTNDLEDLTQQILLSLTQSLPRYDRSQARFRTWLSTVIRNAAFVHFRKHKSKQSALQVIGEEQAIHHEYRPSEIDQFIENEWATYIANQAMEQVRGIFQGQAIEVFELGLDGHSASAIAERTGLTVASVYTLRKRVKKRLYLEIRALAAELEP